MLLTKKQYNELSKDWKKHGTVYQKYDRYTVRFPTLLKHITLFTGKNVLEVGSNAGLAGYHIAQIAKSYTGVEGENGYYNQALEIKKQIKNKDVEFMNMSVKTFMRRTARGTISRPVDAVFLSYVLYHFSDKEVDMFQKNVLPKVDVIIVMSRYAKRNKKGRRKHNNHAFWHYNSVINYLQKNGFETKWEFGPDKKFHIVIGTKPGFVEPEKTTYTKEITEELAEGAKAVKKTAAENGTTKEEMRSIEEKAMQESIDAETKEALDGDKGSAEVHREEKDESSRGRSTRQWQGRVSEGKPRGTTQRKDVAKGTGRNLRTKKQDSGDEGVLQPVMEKSTKAPVREKDIQKVAKAPRTRRSTKANENSTGEHKPSVQKNIAQGEGLCDKD